MSNNLPAQPVVPDSARWKPVQRGFPLGIEVLTEVGWINLRSLYSQEYLGNPVPFKGNGRPEPGYKPKTLEWGQWSTLDTFPKVASVDPISGGVFFTKPSRFIYYRYEGRLVHLKMKGVDMLSSLFSDWWVKPKYGRSYKFVLADNIVRTSYGTANYMVLNKFNIDTYGEFNPAPYLGDSITLEDYEGNAVNALTSEISCDIEHPITLIPKKHVKRKRIWDFYSYPDETDRLKTDILLFNLVVPPFHNLIVRRERKDNNPRTPWIGGAVVFGDGLDKSELQLSSVATGGSYSLIRPDWRTIHSNNLKK